MAPCSMLSILLALLTLIFVVVTSASPAHPRSREERKNWKSSRRLRPEKHSLSAGRFNRTLCPSDHFKARSDGTCTPCSSCPANQIIRRPCGARRDTRCGPFTEFNYFLQRTAKPVTDVQRVRATARRTKNGRRKDKLHKRPDVMAATEADVTSLDGSQWRTLSVALIVVLCVVCCVLATVALYVCVMYRRAHTHTSLIFREPELYVPYNSHDTEPRYVELFPPLRHQPVTSRHLPVYQHVCSGSGHMTLPPASGDVTKITPSGVEDTDRYVYLQYTSGNVAHL